MGLENREYFRDGSYTDRLTGWALDITPAVKYLILANVAVFLLQILVTRPAPPPTGAGAVTADPYDAADALDHPGRVSVVQEWCELSPEKTAQQGQLWRLLTCAFCHDRAAVWHILFNMVLLYWFGTRLETIHGTREFVLFYLAAALCSSLAYVALALHGGSKEAAIGASGAVMGVMVLYTIYYPFETFLAFWFLPVPLWVLLGLYVVYDLHPVLLTLAGDRVGDGVAHAAHLGGLAFGLLYWKLGLCLEAPLGRVRLPRPPRRPAARDVKPPPEPARPPRDALSEQVDEILRKISAEGQGSLTDDEREILRLASARYRRTRG
jgi:membrane associated rhomboid family serine protease